MAFEETEEDAPAEQQLRIFNAADAAWKVLCQALRPEECVSAMGVMLAFASGEGLMNEKDEHDMLVFVGKTAMALSPEVRRKVDVGSFGKAN